MAAEKKKPDIKPAMSEAELRDAGVMIDLPFESGSADPQPLRYGSADDPGNLEQSIIERVRKARGDDGSSDR